MKSIKLFLAAFAVLMAVSCEKGTEEKSSVNPDLNGTDDMVVSAGDYWKLARQDWELSLIHI